MNHLAKISEEIRRRWGTKTLLEMRMEAAASPTSIVFDAIRIAQGPRVVLVLCITEVEKIQQIESFMDFDGDGDGVDWATFTIGELALRAARTTNLDSESTRDAYSRRDALVICATEPRSIRIFEALMAIGN